MLLSRGLQMRKQISIGTILLVMAASCIVLAVLFFGLLGVGRFSSTDDLREFLAEDDTNSQSYSRYTHDCKCFSWDLMVAGIKQHHILLPVPCTQTIGDDTVGHVRCITMVNGKLYWVEPQSDSYRRV